MAKNTLSFSTLGKLKFYSMQHYLSFSQDRVRMRLAVLLGKLCEINAFSHPPSNVAFGLMSIIPDLALLGYPFSLLKKALAIMARRTGNEIWTTSTGLASHFMAHIQLTPVPHLFNSSYSPYRYPLPRSLLPYPPTYPQLRIVPSVRPLTSRL